MSFWMQTNTGKAFDLKDPDPRLVDFENDVASALSKLARYSGHTDGEYGYSVAQHCVLGAETLFEKTGSSRMASLFLLHDAHEAYIGDIATPTMRVLDDLSDGGFSAALGRLKTRLDAAIHRAAGILPADECEMVAIKHHDIAMMNAERYALKRPAPRSWGSAFDAIPAADIWHEELWPWDPTTARDEWLAAFTRFVVVRQ